MQVEVALGLIDSIKAGQRAAELAMRDTCVITRQTKVLVGDREEFLASTVYEGKCKLQTFEPYEQTPETVAHSATVQRYSLHVPVSASIMVGDLAAVGHRRFRVAGLHDKTFQTARRLLVDEVLE